MAEVLKTINKILRIVFIGVIGIAAIVKALDIKPKKETIVIDEDEDYITSEFDEIW